MCLTINDVYDALASDRPYRPGFMPYKAMEIMETEFTLIMKYQSISAVVIHYKPVENNQGSCD